jgi:hypothetical protein
VLATDTVKKKKPLKNTPSCAIHVFALRSSNAKYKYRLFGKWGDCSPSPTPQFGAKGNHPACPPLKPTTLILWTARGSREIYVTAFQWMFTMSEKVINKLLGLQCDLYLLWRNGFCTMTQFSDNCKIFFFPLCEK